MKHIYAGFSETGLKRDINQDSLLMLSDEVKGLFCVADGMGGHTQGEFASSTITACLKEWYENFKEESYDRDIIKMISSLEKTIEKANRLILDRTEDGQICGSTVAILFIYRDAFGVISAGDTRIYRRSRRTVNRITQDETWENQGSNRLSDEEKLKSENYGKLVNAVGVTADLKVNVRTDVLHTKDAFLLCSDGIYKYCEEEKLLKELHKISSSRIDTTLDRIKKEVYERGAGDNLTMILVGISGLI